MDPVLFFDLFTPAIFFSVAFDMDIYMLHKIFWQVKNYPFLISFTHEPLHFIYVRIFKHFAPN